jgi:hypothetical protein
MRTFLVVTGLLCLSALPAHAAVDREAPKTVELIGKLHCGVVAIGAETTGVEIETKDGKYELDFGASKELREKAERLDGKTVAATGVLTIRKGVEVKERKILNADSLKAAEEKRPDGNADVRTGVRGAVTITYVPGVEGAKIPDPVPAKGLTVRILQPQGNKPAAEVKTDDKGMFQLALPAGDYRVEVVPPADGTFGPPPIQVTVKDGEVSEIKAVRLTFNRK